MARTTPRWIPIAAAAIILVAACSPTVNGSEAWTRVQPDAIEQPSGFMTVHHDAFGSPVSMCAPCHPAVDTTMTGIAAGPNGLVAVGWIFEDFRGVAWRSADGSHWSIDSPLPANTVLQAVAADASRYVAVGLNGKSATAWSSIDGITWQQTTSSDAFAAGPLRMTSVIHWSGGFVAGGFAGDEFGSASAAAFWISADGLSWQRAPDSPDLHDARAWSIAAGGPGLVAVGTPGSTSDPGPAVVWTSPDGLHWTRVPASPAFDGARMRAITNVPGIGLIAVGEELKGDVAVVWRSADGISWTRAPETPDFGNHGLAVRVQVRMYAVIAGGPGVVIVGTATEGVQYGEAGIWTSPDGLAWKRQAAGVDMLDSELTAVTARDSRIVAVGDRGAPDTYVATVWRSAAGWAR
jgi:hypothetical protein